MSNVVEVFKFSLMTRLFKVIVPRD